MKTEKQVLEQVRDLKDYFNLRYMDSVECSQGYMTTLIGLTTDNQELVFLNTFCVNDDRASGKATLADYELKFYKLTNVDNFLNSDYVESKIKNI